MAGPSLVVVTGPTATGKTRTALALARLLPAEIVCADSRTIYRGMDVGTAKPAAADRAAVPHHLLDIADPDRVVTLAEYQRLAVAAVEGIRARGRATLLVGGTGLYIRAVVDRTVVPAAEPDWALRRRLEDDERSGGPGTLHRRLAGVDPDAAARIDPRNVRRVIRALEVHARTGMPISVLQREVRGRRWMPGGGRTPSAPGGGGPGGARPSDQATVPPGVAMFALGCDRETLHARIDRRIDEQLAGGLVDEVQRLRRAGYAPALPAMQGLGYKEILAHLEGRLTLDEAIRELRRNTRRYAKRQRTWLRADPRYRWIDVDDAPAEAIAGRIFDLLRGGLVQVQIDPTTPE